MPRNEEPRFQDQLFFLCVTAVQVYYMWTTDRSWLWWSCCFLVVLMVALKTVAILGRRRLRALDERYEKRKAELDRLHRARETGVVLEVVDRRGRTTETIVLREDQDEQHPAEGRTAALPELPSRAPPHDH